MKRYILPVQLITLVSLFWLGLVHAAPAPTQKNKNKKPTGDLCDPVVLRRTINKLKRRVDGLTTSVKKLKDKNKALSKQVNRARFKSWVKKWDMPHGSQKVIHHGSPRALVQKVFRTKKLSTFLICYSMACNSPEGIYYSRLELDQKTSESSSYETYIRGNQTVNGCGVWKFVKPGAHTLRISAWRGPGSKGTAKCWRAGVSVTQFIH